MRHFVSTDEPACWPTESGVGSSVNVAKSIIDDAHSKGVRVVAYYRHMEDAWFANKFPEWVSRDRAGKAYYKRGEMICFNSPYLDFVKKRIVELATYGVDGIYLDEIHQKKWCWCRSCKENKKRREDILSNMISECKAAIKRVNPNCVLIFSSRFEGYDYQFWKQLDVSKLEPHLLVKKGSFSKYSYLFGLALMNDVVDMPVHLWWNPVSKYNLGKNMEEELVKVMAYNHVLNYDINEALIGNKQSAVFLERLVVLEKKIRPYILEAEMPEWVVEVYYPTLPNDKYKMRSAQKFFDYCVDSGWPVRVSVVKNYEDEVDNSVVRSSSASLPVVLKSQKKASITTYKRSGGGLVVFILGELVSGDNLEIDESYFLGGVIRDLVENRTLKFNKLDGKIEVPLDEVHVRYLVLLIDNWRQ